MPEQDMESANSRNPNRIRPATRGPAPASERKLLRQFRQSLETAWKESRCCDTEAIPSERHRALCTTARELLARDESLFSWEDAYQVEQCLAYVYTGSVLDTELHRRLHEAARNLPPEQRDYYAARKAEAGTLDEETKRALLYRLINDLQWQATLREMRRGYSTVMRKNTIVMFLVSLFMFLVLLHLPWLESMAFLAAWHYKLAAVGAGLWGAAFSLLINLRDRTAAGTLENLRTSHSWKYILSRVAIGMGAALILFYFFNARLLTGDVFPSVAESLSTEEQLDSVLRDYLQTMKAGKYAELQSDTILRHSTADILRGKLAVGDTSESRLDGVLERYAFEVRTGTADKVYDGFDAVMDNFTRRQPLVDHRQLALLIVWCFLAGFSESLVPNLLARTEKQIERTDVPPPRREPPA